MYEHFDQFYNEMYSNFYNSCVYKEFISEEPIPYKIDGSLKTAAQYLDKTVILRNFNVNTSEEFRLLNTNIYHELTHYYDESAFQHMNYSLKDINILMLTYSEIHAAYNGIFALFGLKNLSVKKRIDLNKTKFRNKTMIENIASRIVKETQSMNSILGLKYAMYFLGERRALLKIAKDIPAIVRAYDFKRIPRYMREEIINIDKLVNFDSYENIDVEQININRLKADIELHKISFKNISSSNIEGMEDVKKIVENLT